MANTRRGETFSRVCISTQTSRYQNQSTCTCFAKKRYDKSTETATFPRNETTNLKSASVLKRTCTRCHSRKETTGYDVAELPAPYAGSSIRFHEPQEPEIPIPPSRSPPNLTPKEIMNTWVPGTERPAGRLFPPSENYVDVSPRDFSLRKYFPEMFLSESEKKEIRTREREELSPGSRPRQEECRDPKCPRGSCSPREVKGLKIDHDWRTIVDGSAVRTPCPWGEEDIALAREREEVTDEELNSKPRVPPKQESKWFRWSCGKSKREKKPSDETDT